MCGLCVDLKCFMLVLPPQTKHVPHHFQTGVTMYAHLILMPFNPMLQLCLHNLDTSFLLVHYHVRNFNYNYSVVNISPHSSVLHTEHLHLINSLT